MSTKQLLDRWSENNDRPHWIQENRDELMDATGKEVPYRVHAIEAWIDGHKAAMTRKLREAAGEYDDEDGDDEAEADAGSETDETDNEAT